MRRIRAGTTATALVILTLVALAACSSGTTSGPSSAASRAPGTSATSTAPRLTIAPSPPSQTDTAWGRIWDDVPDSFPVADGAEPATDTGEGPASARLVVAGDAAGIADGYVSDLHVSGWTAAKDGPLEDGSIVVNATNVGGCKAQVSVKPIGDASLVTILYGASCPFE